MANEDSKITQEVNAAYQSLAKESPSAELDERILQAAKDSVQGAQKPKFPYQRYSIAASVCLCVLIVSLYQNRQFPNVSQPMTESRFSEEPSRSAMLDSQTQEKTLVNANAAAPEAARFQIQSDDADAGGQEFEEIMVTGSRIRRADAEALIPAAEIDQALINTSYRNSVESWLLQIEDLLDIDEVQAQEEIELFTEAYPEIEVESRLQELE